MNQENLLCWDALHNGRLSAFCRSPKRQDFILWRFQTYYTIITAKLCNNHTCWRGHGGDCCRLSSLACLVWKAGSGWQWTPPLTSRALRSKPVTPTALRNETVNERLSSLIPVWFQRDVQKRQVKWHWLCWMHRHNPQLLGLCGGKQLWFVIGRNITWGGSWVSAVCLLLFVLRERNTYKRNQIIHNKFECILLTELIYCSIVTFLYPTPVPYPWMGCGLESFSALCSIGNLTGTSCSPTSESWAWKVCLVWNVASVSQAGLRCTSFERHPGRICSTPGPPQLPLNKPTAFCSKSRPSSAAWFLRSGGRGAADAVHWLYMPPWDGKRYRTSGWKRWNCLSRCNGCHYIPQMSRSEEQRQ